MPAASPSRHASRRLPLGGVLVYACSVSRERAELEELVANLSDDQVMGVLAELRRRLPSPTQGRPRPPELFGSIASANNAHTDNARQVDSILTEGFGRPHP